MLIVIDEGMQVQNRKALRAKYLDAGLTRLMAEHSMQYYYYYGNADAYASSQTHDDHDDNANGYDALCQPRRQCQQL
jgi:hypothetical protein